MTRLLRKLVGSIRTRIATKFSPFLDEALKLYTQIARPNGKDDDADASIEFSSVGEQLCFEFPDVGVIYAGVLGDNEMQDDKAVWHAIAEKLASLGKCALGFQGKEDIDLRGEDFQRIADLVAGQGPTCHFFEGSSKHNEVKQAVQSRCVWVVSTQIARGCSGSGLAKCIGPSVAS